MPALSVFVRVTAVILVMLLSSVRPSSAQTVFQRTYGGQFTDYGRSVRQTFDGGYIVVGNTNSFGTGYTNVYLIKTNSLGDTLWTRTYYWASFAFGNSVQQTSDSGYIITGSTALVGFSTDIYIIQTNYLGD